MWMVYSGLIIVGIVIGYILGIIIMKHANDAYKVELEKALKNCKAPYEVVVSNQVNKEAKNDEAAWW